MLDPKLLRNNIDLIAKKLARRKFVLDVEKLRNQEKQRKSLQIEIENLRAQRNVLSKTIGNMKIRKQNYDFLCQKVDILNQRLNNIEKDNNILQHEIMNYALSLPNILDAHVPDGCTEKDNLEIFRWGNLRNYDFTIRDHVELGKIIGGLDFSTAVKLTGSRFVVMYGQIAYLHRALIQFMLDVHIKQHGYQEYYVPYLVNQRSLYGTGQLPKFSEDLFHVQPLQHHTDFYTLIPTAEVPLVNLLSNKILDEKDLPVKMIAHTPCFRAEVGSYGRDRRGLVRMHQFDKVEMVQVVMPEASMQALEELTNHAEKILQLLDLPYRKMLLCSGDISFTACKTYDLEVWLPAQNMYREVSSCSNIRDFQARRIQARYRNKRNNQIRLLHTLNGSGLAVGRTLIAILENYQLSTGCVEIPLILQKYMNGLKYIGVCNKLKKL
ncbi:serine--tRNA ligase [Blochmannia endosymbiont of Camponotus (Colobopsis) obliquus]|uniref:serine--tRNA ligase n=1 Tax=Blochmannia endosymbiont of Camponotus (Colobopsis) obliquus TaxID=1505597 RepID=UPI00061A66E2|nr:serine--tRNA ligase [Blochmannia endosymbiont of Camponotus (Colobopsis) obliquus]AKC60543.1 serine--tRNA ligase [Blochmannia endosymbiont of Camponotus (Colobopsis) obliquus]